MIFVTVGAQMPFDRLIRAVDAWAERAGRTDIVAQIGPASYRPQHMRWSEYYPPDAFRWFVEHCECVVAHAGMGSIITALEFQKPMVVLPRRAAFRETRTDHQVDTARHLQTSGMLSAVFDEAELPEQLDRIGTAAIPDQIASHASFELLSACRQFIDGACAADIHPVPATTRDEDLEPAETLPARAA